MVAQNRLECVDMPLISYSVTNLVTVVEPSSVRYQWQ